MKVSVSNYILFLLINLLGFLSNCSLVSSQPELQTSDERSKLDLMLESNSYSFNIQDAYSLHVISTSESAELPHKQKLLALWTEIKHDKRFQVGHEKTCVFIAERDDVDRSAMYIRIKPILLYNEEVKPMDQYFWQYARTKQAEEGPLESKLVKIARVDYKIDKLAMDLMGES